MTIRTTNRLAGPFGFGTVSLPFNFKVFSPVDVLVRRHAADDTITVLTYGMHYTVLLNGDQEVQPGGVVTLLAMGGAGDSHTVTSATPALQLVDWLGVGTLHPKTITDKFDHLTVMIQELRQNGGGSGGGSIPLPAPEANKLLGWNGAGTALVNYDQSSGGGGDMSAYVTKTQLAGTGGAAMVGMMNGPTPSTVSAVIASLRADIEANRIIVTNDAAFNSLLATNSLSPDHFYVVKDIEQVYFATGPAAYFLVTGSGGGGTASGYTKVVTIGDSLIAQLPLLGSAWPSLWAERMEAAGAKVDLHNLAIDGWTFNKARTLKPYAQGTKTMVQAAIDLNPDVVFVQLGVNDAVLNIEGRSLSQVQNDAELVFQQLRTALPSATIVYIGEIMYDQVMFPNPGATLKNKGVCPLLMQRRTSGILQACYSVEILDEPVSATTRNNVANWRALDSHITGLSTINTYFRVNHWRAARLGGCGTDGLHLTQAGNLLLAAYALRACIENATLRARWPVIKQDWFNSWAHPDTMFSDALTAQGDGWVETNNPASEFVMKALGDFRSLTPSNWYLPTGAQFKVSSVKHPANPTLPFYWSITGGPTRTEVYISIAGGAFNAVGAATDALGNCLTMANGAILPQGVTTLRYKCGNEVYGPITIETEPYTPEPQPHLEVYSTANQAIVPETITTVIMNGVVTHQGGGTWTGTIYTVPKSGRYQVNFSGNFEGTAAGRWCQALLYVGPTSRCEGGVNYGAGYIGCTASATLLLTAGQQVSFRTHQGSTGQSMPLVTGARGRSTSATISYVGA